MDGIFDKRVEKMQEGLLKTLNEYGETLENSMFQRFQVYLETEKAAAKKSLMIYGGGAVALLLLAIWSKKGR